MKIIFVLIYVLKWNSPVWSDDWSSIYNSGSGEELLHSDQKIQSEVRNKLNCLHERKKKLFPKYCLQYVESLAAHPMNTEKLKLLKVELNKLCIIKSGDLNNESELMEVLNHPLIDSRCREVLNVRLSDIRYINNSVY